jgi:hypothetical protein
MAEILLSAITAGGGATQVANVPLSASATQTQPQTPLQLPALPKGKQIEGFVINRDAQGNPILRTPMGDVRVESSVFLKTGSSVVIQVTQPQGNPLPVGVAATQVAMMLKAKLISVDGLPVQQLLAQQQQSQQQQAVARNQPVIQTVTTPTTSPSAASAPQQPITTPTAAAPTPVNATILSPANYGSPEQSRAMIASVLRLEATQLPPASQPITMQLLMQSTAPAHAPSAQAPVTFSARIIGHEGAASIAKSPLGTLKLFTPAPLPQGSAVSLQFVFLNNSQPQPLPTLTTPPPTLDALRDALTLLASNPQTAPLAANVATRIPNVASGTVNQVLFFLAALRGDALQSLLGTQALQQIERQRPALAAQLASDFSALRQIALGDAPDVAQQPQQQQTWQQLFFPLMGEDATAQLIKLFWRNDAPENAAETSEQTRFIFDLTLSQWGALQIDGLVRGVRPACICRLILRSEAPLEEAIQDDLQQLFTHSCEVAGLDGQLQFQEGLAHFIHPEAENLSARKHSNAEGGASILA